MCYSRLLFFRFRIKTEFGFGLAKAKITVKTRWKLYIVCYIHIVLYRSWEKIILHQFTSLPFFFDKDDVNVMGIHTTLNQAYIEFDIFFVLFTTTTKRWCFFRSKPILYTYTLEKSLVVVTSEKYYPHHRHHDNDNCYIMPP